MPNIELPTLLPRSALIFSPRAELADELELLLRLALPDVRLSLYSKYPTSNDLANLFQGGTPYFVFIDAVSDPAHGQSVVALSDEDVARRVEDLLTQVQSLACAAVLCAHVQRYIT